MRSDYLAIPHDYCQAFASLRWSETNDAVEDSSGETFALLPELHRFIEGYASRGRLLHFGHILHLLYLFKHGQTPRHNYGPLVRAWRETGRLARNAGVLSAHLCRSVPPTHPAPLPWELAIDHSFPLRIYLPEIISVDNPPLDVETFEATVAIELEQLTFAELVHWLRHGQEPVNEVGEEVAREILATKPRSLAHALAEVSGHDRLAGAVPFVARLVGALSLPPRRMIEPELPLGGYSDVSTRGQPEQILPSQFALDELEFLRRHAEHELLFYRREEPTCRTREEMVVLFDQGVRTWGRVRLVLAATIFALGELATKKKLDLFVATTSNEGHARDPRLLSNEELTNLLALSDMTLSPAAALESLLERKSDRPRDVVLLTHSRNLTHPDIASAARRLSKGDRLFAVAVDPSGTIVFSELHQGLPVPLSRFHLDLDGTASVPASPVHPRTWTGDVEPIDFPFRFGLLSTHDRPLYTFDHEREWLLVAGPQGMLQAVRTDGSTQEMLPRPLSQGHLLVDIHDVIGVAGGFVVVGAGFSALQAAFYHFADRKCKVYSFALPARFWPKVEWRYLHRHHALALRIGEHFDWVHLPTGKQDVPFPDELRWPTVHEDEGTTHRSMPYQDTSVPRRRDDSWRTPTIRFERDTGTLTVMGVTPAWGVFTPNVNGQPVLVRRTLLRAECQRETLACLFEQPDKTTELRLFAAPLGLPIGTLCLPPDHHTFTLSSDGRLLAVQRGANQMQVRAVQPGLPIRAVSTVGRFHNNIVVELGEMMLCLRIDQIIHWLDWRNGELSYRLTSLNIDPVAHSGTTRARPGRRPGFLGYDRGRFRLAAWSNLIAVVSLFGEVFLFEQTGELVCGFFAFRQQFAAWMPDGTCLGPIALLRQPSSADAHRRIGQALRDAWERGERTVT